MRETEVGERSVCLRFAGESVPDRKALTVLVKKALARAGLPAWERVEMDIFSASGDSLVIARPGPSQVHGFFFSTLEDLLAGALVCANGASGLYEADGGYVLTVGEDALCPALYEFGQMQTGRGPLWQCHAQEQGQCIFPQNAIFGLRHYFATGSNDCEIKSFVV